MNFTFLDFMQLIGALGMFLFGMIMMSEALQKVAGNRMRSILSSMTRNRFMGVLTGFGITAIIQSSSATTVMVVSFVNAGLLSLTEAISVIMGANIGTTVTAWLVSLIGFKFSIGAIAVPLMGVALPFIFSKKDRRRSTGQAIIGFALLFLGLEFLKNGMPDLKSNPEILQFLSGYTDMGYGSVLLFLLVGTMLTIVLQSSSATMALTLVMLNQGWISLEIGCALVLGENIGTTITANLAALAANTNAKRAAISHTLFNLLGVVWMLAVFYPFTKLMFFMASIGGTNTETSLIALSLFHTCFNVCNVLIMIWFVKLYERIVTRLLKEKPADKEMALQYISSRMLSVGELSLIEVEKEIEAYMQRTMHMYAETRALATEPYDAPNLETSAKHIAKYEDASDSTELVIGDYLHAVAASPTSELAHRQIRNYLYLTNEIESIADCCFNISRTTLRKHNDKINFTSEQQADLSKMFNLVQQQLNVLADAVHRHRLDGTHKDDIFLVEEQIDELRYALRVKNMERIENGAHKYAAGIHFLDIVEECEHLGDAINKIAREVNFEV